MKKNSKKPQQFNIIPPDLSQKEKALELAKKDIITFGQMFLPEDFMKSSPAPYQYELSNLLLGDEKRICIILPRGHAKSTLAKTALLYQLYFAPPEKKQFIAWVSEEQSQAIDHIKYIQNHIDMNPALQYYFGDLKGSKWTEKEFTTARGDRIIAKGTSQRLRGRSQLGLRYTNIILDDFESELNTKTPDRRKEIKEWVMSTVEPALENSKGNEGSIWLIGTIVHYDSFLQGVYDGWLDAQKDDRKSAWAVMYKKAIVDNIPLWPNYFTKEKLKDIKSRFTDMGLVHKFAQEYLNEARDVENAKFLIDRINYYRGYLENRNGFNYMMIDESAIPVHVYMGVDLAYEANAKSDYQVIVTIGIDSDRNIYLIDYYREHSPLYDMPSQIIDIARKYHPVRRVNVEKVGAQGLIKDHVNKLAGKDRKLAPGLSQGVRPPGGIKKEDRLEALLCPVVNGRKLYIKKEHQEIVDEMFEFPKGRNDDLLDGLWYAVTTAKPPKSNALDIDKFEERMSNREKNVASRAVSWITGQKI
jgi:phage terminase large subunit-like protein